MHDAIRNRRRSRDGEAHGWILTYGRSIRESRPVVRSMGPALRVTWSRFIAGPAKASLEVNGPTPARTVYDQEVTRRF
jgi:hypothetical protein